MKGRTRTVAAVGIAIVMAMLGQAAWAVPTPVDDLTLSGATAIWDVTNDYDYGTSGAPCMSAAGGYTPVEGGQLGSMSDAFDGGLYLHVGNGLFSDDDGTGNYDAVDQQLTVGPTEMRRLQVRRTERALQGSPTLRSLVRLSNPTNDDIRATITWDSALGADDDEKTRASSAARSRRTTANDDWIVASDSATSPSDPPLIFAVYGPGDVRVTNRSVPWAPEDPDPGDDSNEGCVVFRFRVKVPADSTRFLLFFTEMRDTNEAAIARADRFGNVRMSSPLMDGVPNRVASRILNWNLG
jgi:hypothetical protein